MTLIRSLLADRLVCWCFVTLGEVGERSKRASIGPGLVHRARVARGGKLIANRGQPSCGQVLVGEDRESHTPRDIKRAVSVETFDREIRPYVPAKRVGDVVVYPVAGLGQFLLTRPRWSTTSQPDHQQPPTRRARCPLSVRNGTFTPGAVRRPSTPRPTTHNTPADSSALNLPDDDAVNPAATVNPTSPIPDAKPTS